jgi:hypothetical protein
MTKDTFLDIWMTGGAKARQAFREDLSALITYEVKDAVRRERSMIITELVNRWCSGRDIDAQWLADLKKFIGDDKG